MKATDLFDGLEAKTMKLGPDDILVLTVDRCISDEVAGRISDAVKQVIPDQKVLVLSEGLKVAVLTREQINSVLADPA